MIDRRILKRYRYFRRLWRAEQALHCARVELRWNPVTDAGKVRLILEPDHDADFSWLDQDCFSKRDKDETLARADRDGTWGLVGQYLCPTCGQWMNADSVWGFIGQDWKDSGYDTDIMAATLDALAAA